MIKLSSGFPLYSCKYFQIYPGYMWKQTSENPDVYGGKQEPPE